MRVKTDEKRRAILQAATSVFEEVGYERASMSAIAARFGGSKATVYGYFETKEKLFAEAITEALSDYAQSFIGILDDCGPLDVVLGRFGVSYLNFILSDQLIAIQRMSVAEGSQSGLGAEIFRLGPHRGWTLVSEFIADRMAAGELRAADPMRAAYHLKGLLETGVVEPVLQGGQPLFSIDEAAAAARDAFLRIYGPGTAGAV